jgi:two-component system sensor histidine kinase UhpB
MFGVYIVNAIVIGAVIMFQAQGATRAEIASSMQLAEALVVDALRLAHGPDDPLLRQSLDLNLRHVRHIRVAVTGAPGMTKTESRTVGHGAGASVQAPRWFSNIVAPLVVRREFPIAVGGRLAGAVEIRSDPADEVNEAWNYVYSLVKVLLILTFVMSCFAFVIFRRMLRPLARLAFGLKKIEDRAFEIRLPPSPLRELAPIIRAFNRVAEALKQAEDANRTLHRQLLNAQDDERRRTALELHDEAGPCLFALEANATSISNMAVERGDDRLRDRADDVVSLVARIQGINRRVLDRLRPVDLGRMPLCETIKQLVKSFSRIEDAPVVEIRLGSLRRTYGLSIDLTIYRCVQEGLTNASRHAGALSIVIAIDECERRSEGGSLKKDLVLTIGDDGRGLASDRGLGRGLAGIRERIEALGGTFALRSSSDGTILSIIVPDLDAHVSEARSFVSMTDPG